MQLLKYILLLILVINPGTGCSDRNDSVKVKKWYVLNSQTESVESALESHAWQAAATPLSFKLPYPLIRDFQYVWIKGEFDIQDDPSLYCGLSTGRVRLLDKIYINNHLIGSHNIGEATWIPIPRDYSVRTGIIKKGTNIVCIQLGAFNDEYFGISGDVVIQPEREFRNAQFITSLLYKQFPFGISMLFTVIIFVLLVYLYWDRKNKLVIFSCLISVIIVINIFLSSQFSQLISFDHFLMLQFSFIPLVSLLLVLLVQSIYRIYFSGYNIIIITCIVSITALILVFWQTDYYIMIGRILKNVSVIICVPYLIFIVCRSYVIKPDKFLICVISVIAFLAFSVLIFDIYSGYAGGKYVGLAVTYLMPFFLLLFTALVSREIFKRKAELNSLYAKLKYINERDAGKELSITDKTELKLKKIIRFIKENYTADITKEGLASAVELNPNYMSRLFKKYTGMKISEYINKMRIKTAAEKLKDKEIKIIDIAFSLGFESLVTFIRAFKRQFGQTPSEYRDSYK